MERAGVGPSTTVAVVGTGPIGLLIVRACRAFGAPVILSTDLREHRVAAALESGATTAWRTAGITPPVHDPVDVAIDCAGTDAAVATAIHRVRPGGPRGPVRASRSTTGPRSAPRPARRKGLTLSLSRRMRPSDLPAAVTLVGMGTVSLGGLVTHVDDLVDAPRGVRRPGPPPRLKVVVRPQHAIV